MKGNLFEKIRDTASDWFSGQGDPNADEVMARLLAETGEAVAEGAKGYWGQFAVNRVRSYSDRFEAHSYEHMGGLALQHRLDENCRSTACEVGQITADVVTVVSGVVEVGVEAAVVSGSVTGGGLVATGGVTAPAGAVIAVEGAVVGAAVAADGVAVASQGLQSAQEHGRALVSKMEKAGGSAPGASMVQRVLRTKPILRTIGQARRTIPGRPQSPQTQPTYTRKQSKEARALGTAAGPMVRSTDSLPITLEGHTSAV